MRRECTESRDGRYRYVLKITWRPTLPAALFCMLNPSTAGKLYDDPTSTKCITLADRWQCGSVILVNLFARRATDPRDMKALGPAACGMFNDHHIMWQCKTAGKIVCAWGNHGTHRGRDAVVIALMRRAGHKLWCLGENKNGTPEHPLLVEHARQLRHFNPTV